MRAEVISIGDEMTSGARLDTNSQWLSVQLGQLGIPVVQHTTVGDRLEDDVAALRAAAERADVVLITGGLGPTADDLTRDALAVVAAAPLELDRPSLQHIERLFAGRGRAMPERNAVQAMFPRGSRVIENAHGTAPGIDLQIARSQGGTSRFFALPGVPAEMRQMWHATVRPRLIEQLGPHRRVLQHAVVKCFGLGESEMEQRLGQMIARGHSPQVGITVSQATISLRIMAEADSQPQCQAMIDAARQEIHALAGDYVFGEGEEYELQHAVADRLAARGETMATVEIGAGSLIGPWMAELERPDLFRGCLSLADAQAAAGWAAALPQTDVPARTVDDAQQATLPAATQTQRVCAAAQRAFGCDWLLAVDGYPSLRQAGEAASGPHAVQLWVTAADGFWQVKEVAIGGHPAIIKPRIAKAALHFFWQLLQSPGG